MHIRELECTPREGAGADQPRGASGKWLALGQSAFLCRRANIPSHQDNPTKRWGTGRYRLGQVSRLSGCPTNLAPHDSCPEPAGWPPVHHQPHAPGRELGSLGARPRSLPPVLQADQATRTAVAGPHGMAHWNNPVYMPPKDGGSWGSPEVQTGSPAPTHGAHGVGLLSPSVACRLYVSPRAK